MGIPIETCYATRPCSINVDGVEGNLPVVAEPFEAFISRYKDSPPDMLGCARHGALNAPPVQGHMWLPVRWIGLCDFERLSL